MRLANYLTEESKTPIKSYGQIVGLIRKNCKQYIQEVNSGSGRVFLREVHPDLQTFGYLQSLRSKRRPVDIDVIAHNILDDWMFHKFGIRGRSNAWFVWSARNSYDKSFPDFLFAFPYNGYKYLFNPYVNDVYAKLRNVSYDPQGSAENFIRDYGKNYMTKGALTKPETLRVEVMLQAPKCLFVNSEAVNIQSLYGIENPTNFWKDVGITKF
jgi:hypothetical protein